MAEADFVALDTSLSTASVMRGVTAGITPPGGGGSFVYGFNTIGAVAGASGLFVSQADFIPVAGSASIRGALRRSSGTVMSGHSVALYAGLTAPGTAYAGYLLGLSQEDPARIVLRKGVLDDGLPGSAVGADGVLAKSTAETTIARDAWIHLRLDVVCNANGDVVLNAFRSLSGDVTAPSWEAIPGIDRFIDDALGVNSGSAPFIGGYLGFVYQTPASLTRRAFVDQIEAIRAT